MKLSLVTETFPPEINGVSLTNYRLAHNLIRGGHDLELIRPAPRAAGFDGSSAKLRELRVRGWPILLYPSMQIGHFSRARLLAQWRVHRPDVVHIATEGPLGLGALLAARRLKIPVTSTFHTNFHAYCRDYHLGFLRSPVLRYLQWFHNQCAATFVPTLDLLAHLEQAGFKGLLHLGRGVDRQLFHPSRRSSELRKQWRAGEEIPVLLCVSRVAREKNFPLVLESFLELRKRTPRIRMVVVGDGPFLPALRRRFPEAHFAGMRFDEDLAAHYASADLFLFASATETFGNVVLEAMASGLVVLTYNYAAGRQHIEHLQSGILVPFDQPELFKEAARQLFDNRQVWPSLASAARDATGRACWKDVTARFEQALTSSLPFRSNETPLYPVLSS